MTEGLITGYSDILNAVVVDIKASGVFKSGARIEAAPGPLSENFLKSNSMPHGGAFAALSGVKKVSRHSNGMPVHELGLGLYIIPAPARRKRQASDMAKDVSDILGRINLTRWGLSGAKTPEKISASNRYTPTLDKAGTSLWIIEWLQAFLLSDQDAAAKRLGLVSGEVG